MIRTYVRVRGSWTHAGCARKSRTAEIQEEWLPDSFKETFFHKWVVT